MYRKVITYTDFNGNEKTGTFYFNMTRPELLEMQRSPIMEMQKIIERIRNMEDPENELTYEEKDMIQDKMGTILRDLVIQSYGVKSEDGERFTKRIGTRRYGMGEDFVETMAYDSLYVELLSDVKNLVNFVKMIIPENIQAELDKNEKFNDEMKRLEDNITPIQG